MSGILLPIPIHKGPFRADPEKDLVIVRSIRGNKKAPWNRISMTNIVPSSQSNFVRCLVAYQLPVSRSAPPARLKVVLIILFLC